MYLDKIGKILKKYRVPYQNLLFVRDCPREDIWRYKIFPEYKGSRDAQYIKTGFNGGPVFKYTNETILPRLNAEHGFAGIIRINNAEADDTIAVIKTYLRTKYPELSILIVTSDHDWSFYGVTTRFLAFCFVYQRPDPDAATCLTGSPSLPRMVISCPIQPGSSLSSCSRRSVSNWRVSWASFSGSNPSSSLRVISLIVRLKAANGNRKQSSRPTSALLSSRHNGVVIAQPFDFCAMAKMDLDASNDASGSAEAGGANA